MAATDIEKKEPQEIARAEDTRGGRHFVPRVDICEKSGELTVQAN